MVSVKDGLLGVHRWLRDVIDDATMNALFNQKAKLPTLDLKAAEATAC